MNTHRLSSPHPRAQAKANPGTCARRGRKNYETGRNAHAGAPRTERTLGHGPALRSRFEGETRRFGAAAHHNEIGGLDALSPRCSAAFGPCGPGETGRATSGGSEPPQLPAPSPHPRPGGSVPAAPGRRGAASPNPGEGPQAQSAGSVSRELVPACTQSRTRPASTSIPAGPQTHIPDVFPREEPGILPTGEMGRSGSPISLQWQLSLPRAGPPPQGWLQHPRGSAAAASPSPHPKIFPGQPRSPRHTSLHRALQLPSSPRRVTPERSPQKSVLSLRARSFACSAKG